ncbi:MAG: phage scaffolding protein [Clostridia bacterium]
MNEQLRNLLISLEIDEEKIEKILISEIFEEYLPKNEIDNLVNEKMKDYAIDAEISMRLTKANAKNLVACKALIDVETLSFDGEKVVGLDTQIEKIVKENPYLFEDFEYSPISGNSKASEENMTDTEYFNFVKLNKNGGF